MPIEVVCPLCDPEITEEITTEVDADGNALTEQKVAYTTFTGRPDEVWVKYARHILDKHPLDNRAIWAKNSLRDKNLLPEKEKQEEEKTKKKEITKTHLPITAPEAIQIKTLLSEPKKGFILRFFSRLFRRTRIKH